MSDDALIIRDVAKSFDNIQALKGVSFGVPTRSIFGLLGPNGAGKTTLFSIIANFLKADRGEVEVLGIDVRQISKLQGRMTILPQDALFQRNVPIMEQLVFFRLLDGKTRHEAEAEVKRTLDMVGLGDYLKRGVHALSHGMKQRLGLAQAFLGEPEVILLDEATSGLDPENARRVRDLVREMQERATIIFSSHNLLEVQELCDHVAILDEGNLVSCGSVAEITRAGVEVDLVLSRELVETECDQVTAIDGVGGLRHSGPRRYTASLDLGGDREADDIVAALLRCLLDAGAVPRGMKEGNTLEEVFLKVTGRRRRKP